MENWNSLQNCGTCELTAVCGLIAVWSSGHWRIGTVARLWYLWMNSSLEVLGTGGWITVCKFLALAIKSSLQAFDTCELIAIWNFLAFGNWSSRQAFGTCELADGSLQDLGACKLTAVYKFLAFVNWSSLQVCSTFELEKQVCSFDSLPEAVGLGWLDSLPAAAGVKSLCSCKMLEKASIALNP